MAKSILALGEVLWDLFPEGPRFGGAPANFACACAELGQENVRIALASRVGSDQLGTEARQRLVSHGVDVSHLQTCDRLTGQVLINLDSQGKASYRFLEDPAWDHMIATPELLTAARRADVVYFGTLGQRAPASREAIRTVVGATSPECLRILDLNLRAPHWSAEIIRESLALANVVKFNDEELPLVAEILNLVGDERTQLQTVMEKYSLRLIALTRGGNGSLIMTADGQQSELSATPVSIVDTVGAGDAFTACVALGLAHGLALEHLHRWAVDAASYVCTQSGATPKFPTQYYLVP